MSKQTLTNFALCPPPRKESVENFKISIWRSPHPIGIYLPVGEDSMNEWLDFKSFAHTRPYVTQCNISS